MREKKIFSDEKNVIWVISFFDDIIVVDCVNDRHKFCRSRVIVYPAQLTIFERKKKKKIISFL